MKTFFFNISFCFLLVFSLVHAALGETVKMQLSWKHQFQFAGYYAAIEKGFYKDEGLDVELVEGGPGVVCNEDILLNGVQYCNGLGSVVKQRIDGEAIIALASFLQYSPVMLITLKDSGLFTPSDLIGKRVETLIGGTPIAEITAMFQFQGIALNQLDNRENSSGIDALINGQVDAMYGFATNEPYQLESLGVDYHAIYPRDYGIDFYGDALFTSESELLNYPIRVDKFLRASIKGWEYAMDNRPEIVRLILEKYSTHKTYGELIAEANAIEKIMMRDLIKVGHINKDRWQATAETLMAQGLVEQGFSLDRFVYRPKDKPDYAWLLKLLAVCLSIATLVSLVLWVLNRGMSDEIKKRTDALGLLSLANEEIREQAYTDELSGMGNRRAFYEQAEAEIHLATLDNKPLTALVIDIDHFKAVNDRFGHAAGDKAIQKLAAVILGIVRANDAQGRVGGEEFAIIATNTGLAGAVDLAERIRLAVETLKIKSGLNVIKLTVSIGVTAFNPEVDDIHSLLACADKALYEAKNRGRNQVVIIPKCPDSSAIIEPIKSDQKSHEHRTSLTTAQ